MKVEKNIDMIPSKIPRIKLREETKTKRNTQFQKT